MERLSGFMYDTRLSADDVAALLRQCHAPEPWVNPSACVAVGTVLDDAPSPVFAQAQKALYELRAALTQMLGEQKALTAAIPADHRRFLSNLGSRWLQSGLTAQKQTERFLTALMKAPDFLELERPWHPWHANALFLACRYEMIVGSASRSANGPSVRFVKAMLSRLRVANVSCSAIENVLRRGVKTSKYVDRRRDRRRRNPSSSAGLQNAGST